MGIGRDLASDIGDIQIFRGAQSFVKRIIKHDCARPWYVYVETFAPAAVELAVTVTLLDVEDALRQHGEMIVAEGGRKSGRGGRHTGRITVTGKETGIQKYTRGGLKTLLVLTKPLEAIGFAWLLYGAFDNFFFNWATALENSGFCEQPAESGPLIRSRGPGNVTISALGAPVILNTLSQNRGGWSNGVFSAALPGGNFQASFGLTVIGPPLGASPVWIRLRVESFFGTRIFQSGEISLNGFEEASMIVNADFFLSVTFGGSIIWEVGGVTIPVGITTVKGHVFVQRVG